MFVCCSYGLSVEGVFASVFTVKDMWELDIIPLTSNDNVFLIYRVLLDSSCEVADLHL